MTKYVESDLLQIKPKTNKLIMRSYSAGKWSRLTLAEEVLKLNCHKSSLRIKESLKKRVLISFDSRANKKVDQ